MAIKAILSIIFFLPFSIIHAQFESPYQCMKKKDGIICSIGIVGLGAGYYLHTKTGTLEVAEIQLLDKNSINRFDRIATSYSSMKAKTASDVFFYGTMAMPAFFVFSKRMRKDVKKISLIYGETLFLTLGITAITKKSVLRNRPFVYARFSFFSGHASIVAASSFFTAKVFSDYYSDSKWKPVVWGAAATIPAITGYLRVRAGKHFPTDVITGYAVGAAIGMLVPHLHKRKKRNKNVNLSVNPMGGYFSWRF
jgi:membrane-associated phospholipid phosphatase